MIRIAEPRDAAAIVALYRVVAAEPRGLARLPEEVSERYVASFMDGARARGAEFVFETAGTVVGEIHAYRPEPQRFAHVLSDLTIAVHPSYHGRGIGRRLFQALLEHVRTAMPDIQRVELLARASNTRAIGLYQSLGFVIEGRFHGRVRDPDGHIEDDVPMAWYRPR